MDSRLKREIIHEFKNSPHPLRLSEVADELDEPLDEVREVFNELSRENKIASTPDFYYEWLGDQTTKKPE